MRRTSNLQVISRLNNQRYFPADFCTHVIVLWPAYITHACQEALKIKGLTLILNLYSGATALYLGAADLTPLPKGAASAAGLEVNLPVGLFAMRGNYRGDDDSAASWSLPVNVSSGLVSGPPQQTLSAPECVHALRQNTRMLAECSTTHPVPFACSALWDCY